MSDMHASRTGPRGTDLAVFGLFGVLILGFFWFASGARDVHIRHAPVGFDGLGVWLKSNGTEATSFHGGWYIDPEVYGLRVLPLFDTDLTAMRPEPQTKEELLFQQDERDLRQDVVAEKLDTLPTLLVLPKWRSGMRLARVAHPALLDPQGDVTRVLQQALGTDATVVPVRGAFADFPVVVDGVSHTARLYAPQVIEGSGCTPLIGTAERMVLGECAIPSGEGYDIYVHVLSDPDLFNNHGLRLGDNALIAKTLLPEIAGEWPILIDYSTSTWVSTFVTTRRDREWSDLARFFEPPFTILWLGFLALTLLVLWRAGLRYGAPIRVYDDGPGAAKSVSIDAKARLLRLSGNDPALLSAFVAQRLQGAASDILGPHRPPGDALEAILRRLSRQAPDLATNLRNAAEAAREIDPTAPQADVVARLDHFEETLEKVMHDFGRTSRRG